MPRHAQPGSSSHRPYFASISDYDMGQPAWERIDAFTYVALALWFPRGLEFGSVQHCMVHGSLYFMMPWGLVLHTGGATFDCDLQHVCRTVRTSPSLKHVGNGAGPGRRPMPTGLGDGSCGPCEPGCSHAVQGQAQTASFQRLTVCKASVQSWWRLGCHRGVS